MVVGSSVFAVDELVGDTPPDAAGAHATLSPQHSAAIIVLTTASVFHLDLNPSEKERWEAGRSALLQDGAVAVENSNVARSEELRRIMGG